MANDQERIDGLVKKLNQLVDHIEDSKTKAAIKAMFEDQEFFFTFLSTPASTQSQYGGAYVGGLLNYSILTTSILKKLSDSTVKLSTDDILVAGLFHHLGKIGKPTEPVYIKLDSDWHNKKGIMYEYNKAYIGSGINHNITSLWYLNKYKVPVSIEAYEAIAALTAKADAGGGDDFTGNKLTILLLAASRLAWTKLKTEEFV